MSVHWRADAKVKMRSTQQKVSGDSRQDIIYIGSIEISRKKGYNNRWVSFRNERYVNSARLSKYIRNSKEKFGMEPEFKWPIPQTRASSSLANFELILRSQGAFPPGFYLLREGWVYCPTPEAPPKRGMPTGPRAFLEPAGCAWATALHPDPP